MADKLQRPLPSQMSATREDPVSPELSAIAEKYWDRHLDDHEYTSWADMLNAVKEAYELGRSHERVSG